MKVKILPKTSNYHYDGKVYKAEDILEIPENLFVPYIMEEVVEAKPVKVEKKKKQKAEIVEVKEATEELPEDFKEVAIGVTTKTPSIKKGKA